MDNATGCCFVCSSKWSLHVSFPVTIHDKKPSQSASWGNTKSEHIFFHTVLWQSFRLHGNQWVHTFEYLKATTTLFTLPLGTESLNLQNFPSIIHWSFQMSSSPRALCVTELCLAFLRTCNLWSPAANTDFADSIGNVHISWQLANICYWFLPFHKKFNNTPPFYEFPTHVPELFHVVPTASKAFKTK